MRAAERVTINDTFRLIRVQAITGNNLATNILRAVRNGMRGEGAAHGVSGYPEWIVLVPLVVRRSFIADQSSP